MGIVRQVVMSSDGTVLIFDDERNLIGNITRIHPIDGGLNFEADDNAARLMCNNHYIGVDDSGDFISNITMPFGNMFNPSIADLDMNGFDIDDFGDVSGNNVLLTPASGDGYCGVSMHPGATKSSHIIF